MVRTSLLGPEEGQECSQPRSGAVTGTSTEFSHLLQQATRPPPGWSGPTNWHSALNSTTISIGYKNSTWMISTPPLSPKEVQEHSTSIRSCHWELVWVLPPASTGYNTSWMVRSHKLTPCSELNHGFNRIQELYLDGQNTSLGSRGSLRMLSTTIKVLPALETSLGPNSWFLRCCYIFLMFGPIDKKY